MPTFEWVDATSVEQATQLLADGNFEGLVLAKAGGVDILDLMKEGILAPARLVNLLSIPGLDRIVVRESGELEIGALTTLARIADDAEIRAGYSALSEAASHAAAPQIRAVATIGGNLLQKPRCWYFRGIHSNRRANPDGDRARSGQIQHHAIFDNGKTSMVHASTPATALAAYNAAVELVSAEGIKRTVPLREFFLPSVFKTGRVTVIEPGELLTHVILPALPKGTTAAYHKQTERDSYDWPICDVAVVLDMKGRTVLSAAIAMGWVAPTPRRAAESENILSGQSFTDRLAQEAAHAAVASATPLSKNAYKVEILEAVVRRTIQSAAAI